MRHYTIPIFVPELACPNRCVFCNQHRIAGTLSQPGKEEVIAEIEKRLKTIPQGNRIEIGFFGGNFTGIDPALQHQYLSLAKPYVERGDVHGIRLSTRPDYIDSAAIKLLKQYPVTAVELGAQSMDEEVLKLSGRGHSTEDVIKASQMLREAVFELGLQMMIGLPGDSLEKTLLTAQKIVEVGSVSTRIYPTLVIKDTQLDELYRQGKYIPLSLEEAIEWTKEAVKIFEKAGVKILRIGLHPSEGILNGESLVAGPFHVAFGELVETALWQEVFKNRLPELEKDAAGKSSKMTLRMDVPAGKLNTAIGHASVNRKMLEKTNPRIRFIENADLSGREIQWSFTKNYR